MADDEIIRPTPERLRQIRGHDQMTETQSGGVVRKTGAIRVWNPLENLYRNRGIDAEAHHAGLKYFSDWWIGTQSGRSVTMKWSEYISGLSGTGDMDAAERRVFHSKRFAKANVILEEMDTRKLVHWFVINEIPAEQIGRKHWGLKGKHTASGKAVGAIETSLNRLARFYGLK